MQIHMEGDDDSLAQLDNLIASAGPVTIILSHCLVTASRAAVRKLLERHPSAYCELSARGAPVLGESIRWPARSASTTRTEFRASG